MKENQKIAAVREHYDFDRIERQLGLLMEAIGAEALIQLQA